MKRQRVMRWLRRDQTSELCQTDLQGWEMTDERASPRQKRDLSLGKLVSVGPLGRFLLGSTNEGDYTFSLSSARGFLVILDSICSLSLDHPRV